MPGWFSPEEQRDWLPLDQVPRWGEVDPAWSHTPLGVSSFSPVFSSFHQFAVGHCRSLTSGFAASSLPLLSPKSQLACPVCIPAAQLQMVVCTFHVWISEYNQSQAHMEVGFPCTAAVVCWEKLKLLHLSCAERSILSPSVSQPPEQPRASAWHRCWGNAGKH